MKKLNLNFTLATVLTTFVSLSTAHAEISDFLEAKPIATKISKEVANLDVGLSFGLGDIDVVNGVNIGLKQKYEVESSYLDQYYSRIDKYTLGTNINVGDILENFIDVPFSFSVKRDKSFYFVRQFKQKKDAYKALPYAPTRLPLSADKALENLEVGDFASIPAELSVLVEARADTATVTPIIVSANARAFMVVSGEFDIQVFKLDKTHVRLKVISKRGYSAGAEAGAGISFNVFGIRVLDKQLEKILDKDFVKLGYDVNDGEQFIIDYVFNLADRNAKEAYDQVLKSNFKFKDIVVMNQLGGAKELKNKLISSFVKAEKLFEEDKLKAPDQRRISRVFKGFNDYKVNNKRLKLALLYTSLQRDTAYTENNVTYTNKDEVSSQYFYPTNSRYLETKWGKWAFELKDQNFQNNFGLIPQAASVDAISLQKPSPEFGLSYERRDKRFSPSEQRAAYKYLMGQLPTSIGQAINIKSWDGTVVKRDSKVNFQLILKSQGFKYLYAYSQADILALLNAYISERQSEVPFNKMDVNAQKLKDFLHINKVTPQTIELLATNIYNILRNPLNDPKDMLSKLVRLTQETTFNKIGVGFLISLIPEENLKESVYVDLSVSSKGVEEIKYTFGKSNYAVLYRELSQSQSRISTKSYDLRLTAHDHEMEDDEVNTDVPTPGPSNNTVSNELF